MDESHGPGKRSYARSFPQTYAFRGSSGSPFEMADAQDGHFVSGNRELLDQFCARVIEAGVPLSRAWLHIRTLHPEFAGVSQVWRRGMQIEERFSRLWLREVASLSEQSCPACRRAEKALPLAP